jgi:putative SOS response-associated peptidase YedK
MDTDCAQYTRFTWKRRDLAESAHAFLGAALRRCTKTNPVEGEDQLFGILTTEANDVVGAIHPKAMPVVLTTPEEIEAWMTAPEEEALKLQRPMSDGTLAVVARGERKDEVPVDA